MYDARGALFAGYSRAEGRPVPATVEEKGSLIEGDQLVVTTPVQQGNASLGTVYMQTAIDPISMRFERYGVIGLLVAMGSLIFILLGVAQGRLRDANEQLQRQGQDLARANENLRTQIEQREFAETALRQVQKMEAIGQLTGGIAHDFNNLLQVIIGNIEDPPAPQSRPDDAARRLLLSMAQQCGQRAATLTQRLLAFARRQPLDPKPIDVNKLVTGMSELLHRTLGESMRIETVLAGGIWRVAADANQLENAMLNLAVNARDAMPSGES